MRCRVSGVDGGRDHDGVAFGQHVVEPVGVEQRVGVLGRPAGRGAPAGREDAAAEGADPQGDRSADVAQADDADGRAGEGASVGADEFVFALERLGLRKALPVLEQSSDDPLGHRARADARGIRHHHSRLAHAGPRELLDAGADPLDPVQTRRQRHEIVRCVERDEDVRARERLATRFGDTACPGRRLGVGRGLVDAQPVALRVDRQEDGLYAVECAECIHEARLVEGREAEAHHQLLRSGIVHGFGAYRSAADPRSSGSLNRRSGPERCGPRPSGRAWSRVRGSARR